MAPPRKLTLGIVAPSGFLPDPGVVDRAARFFAAQGWRVVAGESVFAKEQRFAGPDALRIGELQRFATDPSVDAVLQGASFAGVGAAASTAADLELGFFDRLLLSPCRRTTLLVGPLAYAALRRTPLTGRLWITPMCAPRLMTRWAR